MISYDIIWYDIINMKKFIHFILFFLIEKRYFEEIKQKNQSDQN